MSWNNYERWPKRKPNPNLGPSVRRSYGTTWWGKEWLNALTQIDNSNRLPRGKTYANKGAAHSIEISQNTISALVEGSQPKPYKVRISVPKFDGDAQSRLVELVSDNPFFLSKLLNRELPPELNEACLQQKIHIFPRKWADLNGSCSCPDYAVPCKHLAAVLFMVASEIDKNPFLVFDLHDFDLVDALQKAGFADGETEDVPIVAAASLRAENVLDGRPDFTFDEAILDALDFSKIPDCRADLGRLLSEKPVFYPEGDFKKNLADAWKNVAAAASLPAEKTTEAAEKRFLKLAFEAESVVILANEEGQIQAAELLDRVGETAHSFQNAGELVAFLAALPPTILPRLAPEIRGLHLAFRFAEHLARRSAWVPQLLRCGSGDEFALRFVPALLNGEVRSVFEAAKPLLPIQTLFFSGDETVSQPLESDGATALLAVFLHFLIEKNAVSTASKRSAASFENWFFGGAARAFSGFGEREKPKAVQLWLSRFFIAEKAIVPVFQVFETDDGGFEVGVAIADRSKPLEPPVALADLFSQKRHEKMRLSALRDLSMVAEFFPPLASLIASKGREKLVFDSRSFVAVFFEALPVIRLFGIQILLPKALRNLLRPLAGASLSSKNKGKNAGAGLLSFASMIDFEWQIALGDRLVSPDEFLKMVKNLRGIVRLADGYAFVDEKEIQLLLSRMEKMAAPSPAKLLQIALTGEFEGAPVRLDDDLKKLIEELLRPGSVPLPDGLRATLRPYQKRGFEWLCKNARLGFGSLIGDDMGLGKTVQVIAALLKLRDDGLFSSKKGAAKALVVVPTTLLTNWQKELSRFAPSLAAHVFHGPNRSLDALDGAEILLTTYGAVRSDLAILAKKTWAIAVIDEAQNIKNLETAQTKAVKKLAAPLRIAMTGTPVENRLSEFFSILDFANHGLLGSLGDFSKEISKPIEVERDHAALKKFRRLTEPFLLRRLKTDKTIISDLPDKIETDQFFSLAPAQAALYQNVVDESLRAISAENEEGGGIKRQGLVLKMLTALKQVCNHPANFLKTPGPLDASLSGKTELLLELIENLLENGEKALIFTQYEEMGSLLAPLLKARFGVETPFLHGGVSRKRRDEMVEDFQKNRATRLFLLSLKAGGTGLNLTAASSVIHYDLWWNPAVEAQATDRAFRIGQTKNVQVHRLLAQGTFEEKINEMLQAKKALANLTVATGEKWVGELSNSELRELVRLG